MITDVIMPLMSGREMAQGLKAVRPDTRVLFMSGFTDDAIVHHGVLDESDGYRELHAMGLPIPIVLDESCHTLPDVGRAAGLADGVNIKLTKSGGIREAHRMIHAARSLGLRVMLGCMNESSLGIAQAAQLAPLVDVVDLDGHLLNQNDAFQGLELRDGAVLPSTLPGLGVTPLEPWP